MRFVSALLVLTLSLAAFAADDRGKARDVYASGQRHYDLAEYAAALADFKEAYRQFPAPGILYNIGQCHKLLGHLDEAIDFYRTYLIRKPEATNADEVRALIARLEKRSADDKARAAAAPPVAPTATEPAPASVPTASPTHAPAAALATTSEPPPRKKPLYERWWLWTAVGGVAAVGLGVGLGVGLYKPAAQTTASDLGTVRPFALGSR
jgi:tetratricopeptide (TPR) repeat protein